MKAPNKNQNRKMEYCIEKIETILEQKLLEALDFFGNKELCIVDIGVFPWHKTIELSFLFSGNEAETDDIAAWPYFNYSKMNEGGWDEALDLANEITVIWNQNHDALPIFMDFGSAATSEKVQGAIQKFNCSSNFKIQVLNPDDSNSENFCELL